MRAQVYITDYGNGIYQASYLCLQRGYYKLRVTLNGVNVGIMSQSEKMRPSPVGKFQKWFCAMLNPTLLFVTQCSVLVISVCRSSMYCIHILASSSGANLQILELCK
jgi:hypothetical protein